MLVEKNEWIFLLKSLAGDVVVLGVTVGFWVLLLASDGDLASFEGVLLLQFIQR
jgi:hypothetical protein